MVGNYKEQLTCGYCVYLDDEFCTNKSQVMNYIDKKNNDYVDNNRVFPKIEFNAVCDFHKTKEK